jgi:hypothetical protein
MSKLQKPRKASNWDKKLVVRLKGAGFNHEQACMIVGVVADAKQQADLEGYARGYNSGFADARTKLIRNGEI